MDNRVIIDILGDICTAWCELSDIDVSNTINMINTSFGEADYRIANLEAPFVHVEKGKIDKDGPNLFIKSHMEVFFKRLNIDGFSLANNHIGDYGENGVTTTINDLDMMKKDHFGAGYTIDDAYQPLRIKIKEKSFSCISMCENEFGGATQDRAGTATFQLERSKRIIIEEKEKSDYVVVLFHGGVEHAPFPSPNQIERYHLLVDFGADVVIGSHTHCLQGQEEYNGGIIVYSLGDFFFPRKEETVFENWYVGMTASIVIDEDIQVVHSFHRFNRDGSCFTRLDDDNIEKYYYGISTAINNEQIIEKCSKAWAYMSGVSLLSRAKVFFDSDKNKVCAIKNLFSCEAHREVICEYLNILYYKETIPGNDIDFVKKYMRIYEWINEPDNNNTRQFDNKVVLWGCSGKTEKYINEHKDISIVIVDNSILKQDLRFMGIEIISPETAFSKYGDSEFVVCTSDKHFDEISSILKNNNIKKIDFIYD